MSVIPSPNCGSLFQSKFLKFSQESAAFLTGKVFAWLESNKGGWQGPVQSTSDNSNLQEKSKEVRVIGSSKQVTENKEMGWRGEGQK